jgi:hypothetical protein
LPHNEKIPGGFPIQQFHHRDASNGHHQDGDGTTKTVAGPKTGTGQRVPRQGQVNCSRRQVPRWGHQDGDTKMGTGPKMGTGQLFKTGGGPKDMGATPGAAHSVIKEKILIQQLFVLLMC